MSYLIAIAVVVAVAGGLIALLLQGRISGTGQQPSARHPRAARDLVEHGRGLLLARRPRPGRIADDHGSGRRPLYDDQPPARLPRDGGRLGTLQAEAGPDACPSADPRTRPARTAPTDKQLGLAVTAFSSAPSRPQQDVYYVQRNVIALARGLRPTGIDQRAAALALSAVMSSRAGRSSDVLHALRDSVTSANRVVRSISNREPEYSDMVTTLDIVVLAPDARRPSLYFAHVGNSSIWLQRGAGAAVEMLSQVHAVDNGPLLRAVGLSQDVVADIGQAAVKAGDRVFLTTASSAFSFAPETMDGIALAYAPEPLQDCAAALADAARPSAGPESITVVAAEVALSAMFWSR